MGNIPASGGGGAAVWGSIIGTLSNQTDLQSALDAKATASVAAPYVTVNGTVVGPAYPLTAPPLTGWTADNSASLTTSGGYLYIAGAATSAVNLRGIYRTAPSAPYTRSYLFDVDISGDTTAGNELGWAIGFRQSSTGKIVVFMSLWSGGTPQYQLDNWTDSTHVSSTVSSITGASIVAAVGKRRWFFRVADDNTNLKFSKSIDGVNWIQVFSVARGAFMTGGPDQLFIGLYPNSGAAEMAVYSMA